MLPIFTSRDFNSFKFCTRLYSESSADVFLFGSYTHIRLGSPAIALGSSIISVRPYFVLIARLASLVFWCIDVY